MTVLVIGAAGLVGSHLRRAFGTEPVVATYHRTKVEGARALDITDAAAVRAITDELRPAVIALAAAEAWVERCEREPAPTRLVNVAATRAVVDGARRHGALLIAFSSEYVFDGASGPYGEDGTIAPINEYGRQKAEVETLVGALDRHVICRTTGVFGWELAGKNFVCQLLRRLRSARTFEVPNDQVITPTYAPDLARAVVELVRRGHRGTFNVVGPATLSRIDVARQVARAFSLPQELIKGRPTAELGLVARRPRHGGLRDDKLRQTLGWSLSPLDEALSRMRKNEDRGVGAGQA